MHNILAEMVMGGMVLETNMNEIITQVDAQNKMEKSEVSLTASVTVQVDSTSTLSEVSYTVCRHVCTLHPACPRPPMTLWMLPDLLLSVCAPPLASPTAAAQLLMQIKVWHIPPPYPEYEDRITVIIFSLQYRSNHIIIQRIAKICDH